MEHSSLERIHNPRLQGSGLYSSLQRLVGDLTEEHQRRLLSEALEEVMTTLEEMESSDDDALHRTAVLSEAQSLLEAERRRYQDLFDSTPVAYLVTDSDGRILQINQAAARLLQTRGEQVAGRPVFGYFTEPDPEGFRRELQQLSEQNRVLRRPVHLKPRHAAPLDAELTVTLLSPPPGQAAELRWMIRETPGAAAPGSDFQKAYEELRSAHASAQEAAQRRIQELEEANRTLQAQIAERRRVEDEIVNRSRDLERRLEKRTAQYQEATRAQDSMARFLGDVCANPLRALDIQTRQLLERWSHSLPPEGRKQMAGVAAKTRCLNDLLEAVSTYARVAKQPMERQKVDTAALVSQVLQELTCEHDGRCVEIRVGDLAECEGDPALLRMAFTHLLTNAFKFTRTRDVAIIEIQCRRAGHEIIWSVRDNGIGFRKDQAHRLFVPFQRLHRTQGYDGAGVGLATVHRIAGRHDGRAWAECHDPGATFYFALPAPVSRN